MGVRERDHMRRWSLPLLLAVLLAAPGCVTVHPAPAPGPATTASPGTATADHKQPGTSRPGQRAAEPAALPLSPLPGTHPGPAQRAPGPAHEAPAAGTGQRSPTAPRRARQQHPRPHRASTPKAPTVHPNVRTRPKATRPTKAGARTPAPHRPGRPAPGVRAGDMAALCRSAHGVNSPSITALCRDTYGR